VKSSEMQSQAIPSGIAGSWIGQVFDASPLGILHVDLSGRVLYMNEKSLSIWGFEGWEGKTIRDLFTDEATYRQIQSHIAKRRQRVSEEYEVEITRSSDGKRIPIRIAGWPLGTPGKGVVGAISIIRSLEVDKIVQGFNWHIAEATTAPDLLAGIAAETRKVLAVELLVVSIYSRNMRSARVLFASPEGILSASTRWYRLSDKVFAWAQKPERVKVLLRDFYHNFNDQPVQFLVEAGLVELMRCPVRSEGRLVASVTLFTKRSNGFSMGDFETFARLPMAKAVLAALHLESQNDLTFRLDLLKDISASQSDADLYQCVVDGVAKRYGWFYVSILLIDYSQHCLVLKSQFGQSARLAKKGFAIKVDETVWKDVFGTTCPGKSIPDEKFGPLLRGARQAAVRSSFSLGVWAEEGVYAVLNIEDEREDAIVEDEKQVLRSILDELGNVIDRRRRDNLARASFRSVPIPVVVVDEKGGIHRANPAAQRLLGMGEESLIGKSIVEFIKEPNKKVVEELADGFRNVDLAIPSPEGADTRIVLPVRILSSTIEEADGRRLFAIRDLSLEKKADELQELADIYVSLAREMKTPLSMIGIFLEDLRLASSTSLPQRARILFGGRAQGQGAVEQLVDAARSQLRKVELTYDQLLLRNVKVTKASFVPVCIDFGHFVEALLSDLPQLELNRIDFIPLENRIFVRGDQAQLAFVVETVLGYALRYSPPRNQVHVELKAKESTVLLEISASRGVVSKTEPDEKDALLKSKIRLDISLGRQALLDVLRIHKGHFQGPSFDNEFISFAMTLPLDKNQ
jgi:PAS domain S-box-containing protein